MRLPCGYSLTGRYERTCRNFIPSVPPSVHMDAPYESFISIDPETRFGRPCLTGTRIAVADVLGWLGNGLTSAEILADFPELTEAQIRACLRYAADRERHTRLIGDFA